MLPGPSPRLHHFSAGREGAWEITGIQEVSGEGLPMATRLDVASALAESQAIWTLSSATSNERYVTREEKRLLVEKQQGLGRPDAVRAVLIPIRKSNEWWSLTQEERRDVLEMQSHHIRIGIDYLPAIARRLHHCRDLSVEQPFDFLTWFEFAPADEPMFNELLEALRATPEWRYVEREVEVRVARPGA